MHLTFLLIRKIMKRLSRVIHVKDFGFSWQSFAHYYEDSGASQNSQSFVLFLTCCEHGFAIFVTCCF
jgi:hypothetical protein